MQTLREILSQRQLHFAEELSESDIADIEAFYQQTARDRGGKLNEEELNAVISAYQNLDMIAAGADQTRSEKTEDAEKKEEETHAKLQTYCRTTLWQLTAVLKRYFPTLCAAMSIVS